MRETTILTRISLASTVVTMPVAFFFGRTSLSATIVTALAVVALLTAIYLRGLNSERMERTFPFQPFPLYAAFADLFAAGAACFVIFGLWFTIVGPWFAGQGCNCLSRVLAGFGVFILFCCLTAVFSVTAGEESAYLVENRR